MIHTVAFILFYYAIAWSIPGVIMSAMVSLGDPQRIVFIDHQLSKDVEKLHCHPRCMISSNIACRLFWFWVSYPFIRKRATTESIKFKIFMWVNALGMWSYILCLGLILIKKMFS
ncbi:hypothetical protein MHN79_12805 [Vibrio sp. Of14-4]|nr:hypothetical protein [Vibrio sp. Of14-4]MCG7490370.1 hypothetical protein [Vibrio sp. Of14-4]